VKLVSIDIIRAPLEEGRVAIYILKDTYRVLLYY